MQHETENTSRFTASDRIRVKCFECSSSDRTYVVDEDWLTIVKQFDMDDEILNATFELAKTGKTHLDEYVGGWFEFELISGPK